MNIQLNFNVTHCNKCVFYKEHHECYLKLIDKYEAKDVRIQKTVAGDMYLIDFACPYYSNSFDDIMTALDNNNSFPYFIIMDHHKIKGLYNKILDINRYSIKPKEVHIFLNASQNKTIEMLVKYLKKYATFQWKVYGELDNNTWTQIIATQQRKDFMLYCKDLPDFKYDWANNIYNKINKELVKGAYFYKDDAMLIPAALYNRYYFEYSKDCLIKIKEYLCQHALEL